MQRQNWKKLQMMWLELMMEMGLLIFWGKDFACKNSSYKKPCKSGLYRHNCISFYLCLVAMGGLEPPTPALWMLCSNQLSYIAIFLYFLFFPLRTNQKKLDLNDGLSNSERPRILSIYFWNVKTGTSRLPHFWLQHSSHRRHVWKLPRPPARRCHGLLCVLLCWLLWG